ncbi:MAG TPA: SDR family oxidoreductase [Coleofasciculaceae cyanobacterium]|jgi:NAD(P)-dependent dehydrogenase (short-subunit alcohol dehydrogenase family)
MKFDSLQDKIVVITGASSGIGKLTAEKFLKLGAKVVLAARSIEEMRHHLKVGEEQALAVETDVSDHSQVAALSQLAIAHFGGLDIWINNAGISVYGRFEEITPDEMSRLLDVDLKGSMYGSYEAIRIFKAQGHGSLINVSSVLGKAAVPLQSAYVAAKHGIVGFSESLREELIHDGQSDRISVSLVLPSSMDTPLFRHARSKEGLQPYPLPPVYDPKLTADAIIGCAMNPVPEVTPGGAGRFFIQISRFLPGLAEQYMAKTAVRQQLLELPKPEVGDDNLYAPMPGTQDVRGGIGTTGEHLRESITRHPIRISLSLAIPTLLLALFLRQRKRLA